MPPPLSTVLPDLFLGSSRTGHVNPADPIGEAHREGNDDVVVLEMRMCLNGLTACRCHRIGYIFGLGGYLLRPV